MKATFEQWIATSRQQLAKGVALGVDDLDLLASQVAESRQLVLYLTAKSTSMYAAVVGWALFDPTSVREPTPLSEEPPYQSVLEAVADGWRVVQFPVSSSYQYKDLENDYVGFDFVLEKWI